MATKKGVTPTHYLRHHVQHITTRDWDKLDQKHVHNANVNKDGGRGKKKKKVGGGGR